MSQPRPVRVCIVDMNAGVENQAIRCLYGIVDIFRGVIASANPELEVQVTLVSPRDKGTPVPLDHDLYLSSGGPGSPFDDEGFAWRTDYFRFLDHLLDDAARRGEAAKAAFPICYSFELVVLHWGLARLPPRGGRKLGIMPVYPTEVGMAHPLFHRFGDRFFAFEHRNWEAVDVDYDKLRALDGEVLARESRIGRTDKGEAILALHLGPTIEAVQFHPEGDREGILAWVEKPEQIVSLRETYGDETYERMRKTLQRPERVARVYAEMIPDWMLRSFNRMALHRGWNVAIDPWQTAPMPPKNEDEADALADLAR